MKFISLFSGIGGFDKGFEDAGMTCVAQVEKDKNCFKVLESHWPNVQRFDDVRDVGKNNLPAVDLVCGGFPCQDLSVAGRRKGLVGERSGLWFEFHRIIEETCPRWVVIENVPGLLSSDKGRDFAVILRGLVECGYGVCWRILDSQYFGVAQRRRRVYVVASLGNGRCAQVLFESIGCERNIEKDKEAETDIATIIGTLSANTGGLTRAAGQANEGSFCIVEKVSHPVRPSANRTMWDGSDNLVPDATMHRVRRLMPVEVERLQAFPDGWTFGSDSVRYKQLGNAVTVSVIHWLGQRILEADVRV